MLPKPEKQKIVLPTVDVFVTLPSEKCEQGRTSSWVGLDRREEVLEGTRSKPRSNRCSSMGTSTLPTFTDRTKVTGRDSRRVCRCVTSPVCVGVRHLSCAWVCDISRARQVCDISVLGTQRCTECVFSDGTCKTLRFWWLEKTMFKSRLV